LLATKKQTISEMCAETLAIETCYKGNTPNFEEDDSFAFIIPGVEKKMRFHRGVLSKASTMFSSLFTGRNDSSVCRYRKDSEQVEWIPKIAQSDETYRSVLQKWLSFCYGKDASFTCEELPAALAVLVQLQLRCADEVRTKIEAHMKEIAEKNKEKGCAMLADCATVYDECRSIAVELAEIVVCLDIVKKNKEKMFEVAKKNADVGGVMLRKVLNECNEKEDKSMIDVELAEAVLTCEIVNKNKAAMIEIAKKNVKVGAVMLMKCAQDKASLADAEFVNTVMTMENMKKYKGVLVDKYLMNLPVEYLDMMQHFSEGHDDLSEFSIRLKYVKFHERVLSEEQKRTIMGHCNLGKLNNEELRELYRLGMFNDFSFVEQCHEETIKERDADRVRIANLEEKSRMDREKKEMEKKCL